LSKGNGIRKLVLDVLKLHSPRLTDLSLMLVSIPNVEGVNLMVAEVDANTESIKLVVEGEDLDFDRIKEVLEESGAVIHSIDQVYAGKKIVDDTQIKS